MKLYYKESLYLMHKSLTLKCHSNLNTRVVIKVFAQQLSYPILGGEVTSTNSLPVQNLYHSAPYLIRVPFSQSHNDLAAL